MPPSRLHCTGPAHVFVTVSEVIGTTRGSPQPNYLGTCEYSPSIRTMTPYETVLSDKRGPKLPASWLFPGEHALTRLDLTRWDEGTYRKIAAKVSHPRGSWAADDIGAMVVEEKLYFGLIVLFPYSGKPAFLGMPKGYQFPLSILEEEIHDPVGTQAAILGLIIHSIAEEQKDGSFSLYNENINVAQLIGLVT